MNKNAIVIKPLFLLVLLFFGLFTSLIAQKNKKRDAFFSLNSGGFIPFGKDFKKTYGDVMFINGASIGVPISNKEIFIYGKGMYFHKNGTPIVYHFTSADGVASHYTTQEGEIEISHFQVNFGVQYNINFNNDWTIITNGGLVYVHSREKSEDPTELETTNKGLSGLFCGAGIEKNFAKLPINLFSELQYNTGRVILKSYDVDYASININVGIRYYFKQ